MRAVLFDIDGTLLQSADVDDALYRESVQAVLGSVVLRPSLNDYEFITDSGILIQIFADNGIAPEPDRSADVKRHFVESVRSFVARHGPFNEVPGAKTFLRTLLSSEKYRVALATGGWEDSARFKLESAGFADMNIPIATSDDAYDRVEIMRIALSRLDGEFESVTYYGDGLWDEVASKKLGWNFVAVGPELGGLESFHAVTPP